MEDLFAYIKITTEGPIINENGPTQNPWECHTFSHVVEYEEVIDEASSDSSDGSDDSSSSESTTPIITINSWSMYDENYPRDLEVTMDPKIYGSIKPLTLDFQPSLDPSLFTEKEELKLDGSNFDKTGRISTPTYTFTFKIRVDFTVDNTNGADDYKTYQGDEVVDVPVGEKVDGWTYSNDISIMVIKNNNIDNLIFAYEYMKAGHYLSIDLQPYTLDGGSIEINGETVESKTFEDFINDHPGPFDNCGVTI